MSSSLVALIQQQSAARKLTVPNVDGPFALWSLETIAEATRCPQAAVALNWPLVYNALLERGIADRLVCMAALGTIGVETAHTFYPVREAYWLSEEWRRNNLRYWPWYGRGYIQLTWWYNYDTYGDLIGIDLYDDPDLAMQPDIAARVFAEYFLRADVVLAARAGDWAEVRRRVQGAYAGLDELERTVAILGG